MKATNIFETGWEVCNKVGGIYTVISTKCESMMEKYGDNYILIGPDVWKETTENPDFIEDNKLFPDWKVVAEQQGLKIKIGRWNIPSKPIVILVGFTYLYPKKNEIFAHLWEEYKLDSLSGGWDYIEPAIFGYAAGQVIESFTKFYLTKGQEIAAQFHEWMTGTGILYLKENMPAIGTIFTTHATVLGRSIAGNGFPLYEKLSEYNPLKMAEQFNVISKNSLETLSAKHADSFTTVSSITSKECEYFLGEDTDFITLNGFDNQFIPSEKSLNEIKDTARNKILEVASKLTKTTYNSNTQLILNSGRYEFKNKGIDIFIKSLAKLDKNPNVSDQIIAVIAVPTAHKGAEDIFTGNVLEGISSKNPYLTHKLIDPENDPILRAVKENGLLNKQENKVHIIFIPAYLNKNDGVVNLSYYEFLPAFDYTIFPSYYEPWGYTPMESIAFGIPTVTTNYAGFGSWIEENYGENTESILVADRKNLPDEEVANKIADKIATFFKSGDKKSTAQEARKISQKLLWSNLKHNYFKAWNNAIDIAKDRKDSDNQQWKTPDNMLIEPIGDGSKPTWKHVIVEPELPKTLLPLRELAFNLWWSWNTGAAELFESIDPEQWLEKNRNPVVFLESISLETIEKLSNDEVFLHKLNIVYTSFKEYMDEGRRKQSDLIAYFSMEYGLHNSVKTYSGGLGILAGDYLKQASDSNFNLVAIGLMYRQGYFTQIISHMGDQISNYDIQDASQLPLTSVKDKEGNSIRVSIAYPGRIVKAKAWLLKVGRVHLYLLDTNIADNNDIDRKLSAQLYGGDNEHRLKQEMLLGLGGIRLLEELNIKPAIFHSNEGHSAFIGLERIKNLIEEEHLTYDAAVEYVRATALFTTHTPVPAGHDRFEEHLIRAYLSHFADHFSISWDEFMALGRFKPKDPNESFSMSVLATKLSREVNGVSKIHGGVSREMFQPLYPGYYTEEINIGYVTNGVHYFTWTDKLWQNLYADKFNDGFIKHQSEEQYWKKIYDVSDEDIWSNRKKIKTHLISYVKEHLKHDLTQRQENPKLTIKSLEFINEDCLIFGFARRFATYKRAHLLFTDTNRLAKIVNNPNRQVIFLFAGKAHPNDKAGQDLIKRIIEISKQDTFVGKIIFLENYDMIMGKMLTSGVDVWLNTPTRPLEASGTSGEKAVMNGVMNFSVLDGWWAEGYRPNTGWAITDSRTYPNQELQDQLDAEIIYNTIENEIIPTFFDKNNNDYSQKWVERIKNTIATIAPHFTMERMLNDYQNKYYLPLIKNSSIFKKDHFHKTRLLALWKQQVLQNWDRINVESISIPDTKHRHLTYGKHFSAKIIIDLAGLSVNDIGIEIVMGTKIDSDIQNILFKKELKGKQENVGKAVYSCKFPITIGGKINYSFRIFPKNEMLSSRMDFPLVKWI